jgi:putative copper resistance protein D
MDALLAAARAVHFGSSLLVFGQIVFVLLVSAPAWRRGQARGFAPEGVEGRIRRVLIWSLAASVVSALVWLALEVPLMSGEPLEKAIAGPTFGIVVRDTWFGRVLSARALLAAALFICFGAGSRAWGSRASLLAAGAYVALPALAGHAAGGRGAEGALRVATDMVHLAAAGAWVGALPGVALVLTAARRDGAESMLAYAARATRRFSALGAISVGALVASGVGNAVYLVGSWSALIETRYGMLLVAKLAFVAAMLALAAVNLGHFAPRLVRRDAVAARSLARNAMLETAFGVAVIAIVGVLGITLPAEHAAPHRLHSSTSGAIIAYSSPAHPHG